MNEKTNIRIIGDMTDPTVHHIIELFRDHFGPLEKIFTTDGVAMCPASERATCGGTCSRRCSLVVGIFTTNPSEKTASAITSCAEGQKFSCSGRVLILEPKGWPTRVLAVNKAIRRVYNTPAEAVAAVLDALKDVIGGSAFVEPSSPIVA